MANKTFRILSIDGGGLRGIIPVKILQKLEEITGKRVHEMFDLVAGTSTGGIISCASVLKGENGQPKFSLADIEDIFAKKAGTIFPTARGLKRMILAAENIARPGYNPAGLQSVLEDYFDEERITDTLTPVFVSAYDLNNNRALFFKSRQALTDDKVNARMIDVCRATSAAPTIFPAYIFNYDDPKFPNDNPTRMCIDGGVFINNPEIGAFTEASRFASYPPYNMPNVSNDDICILSLGTGHYTSLMTQKQGEDWGEIAWAPNISDVMMQAVSHTAEYQGDVLTSDDHHLRVQIAIENEKYDDLADPSPIIREYLLEEVNNQVFNNPIAMASLNKFIEDAQLGRGKH